VEFIPVAEDTGLIVAIGSWVIREACAQAVRWPGHIRIAVNVSPVQFHRGGLQESILGALANSGLEPGRLEIEITESIFLEGSEATLRLLHSLRALGVRIALDDFGTGYSSLSYLQSFPFDKLKIDRSFINNLLTRDGANAIVRAITELAHALNIETTAEGVEETAQLMELRSHGCSSVQGFLFAEPMTLGDVEQLFRDDKLSMQNVA
jgi:EAL domain-containing protein (putative c-di-GMP-specific phosphodiesterase class I)